MSIPRVRLMHLQWKTGSALFSPDDIDQNLLAPAEGSVQDAEDACVSLLVIVDAARFESRFQTIHLVAFFLDSRFHVHGVSQVASDCAAEAFEVLIEVCER